jgi:type II secretion system protein C
MSKASKNKRVATKISGPVEERIVEISLQHPDYGARRLVALLKKETIIVSASAVYNILKRHSLQTREKRLAEIKEQTEEPKPFPKKPPAQITDEVAGRIVQISLQNPEYGARRLVPLLEQEGILVSVSSVYTILKRNGLQNRSMRLLKFEEQRFVETPHPQAVAITPPAEELQQVAEETFVTSAAPRVSPVPKAHEKATGKRSWVLTLFNLLLLGLLILLGIYTVQNVRNVRLEPEAVASIEPASLIAATEPKAAFRPLIDYRFIWERNLFNISKEKAPAPKKEIAIEKLALAGKDLGLKLVGTVVADDPARNRAIIHNHSSRQQEAYQEGDQAGKVQIKKIMRNKVVITTEKGDELLTVELEDSGKRARSSMAQQWASKGLPFQAQVPEGELPRAATRSIRLEREEVAASLANPDQLLQDVNISPYMQGDQPAGFRLDRIPPQNIFRKMGLRSRDVVVGVNGEDITGPDQAVDFFRTLGEGGEVTIQINRRHRTRQIRLNIE